MEASGQFKVFVRACDRTYREELAGVLVSISDADGAAVNANVSANTEVLGHEGAHTIRLEHHLALEEGALGDAGVLSLGLDDHNGLVLQVVVDLELANTVVLDAGLDDSLLKVARETEDL